MNPIEQMDLKQGLDMNADDRIRILQQHKNMEVIWINVQMLYSIP